MPKFSVQYRVSGSMTDIIEAESKEAAEAIAQANCEDDGWEPDLDTVDDVDFYVQEMHRVVRDGKTMHTTYVRATDVLA